MADTSIEWTDKVWNPVTGCTKVSQGCRHCYAETIANRFWGERKFTDVQCHPERLDEPSKWRKPRMIFVNSMSDLFHEAVPDEFIWKVFDVISHNRRHIYQILTKRPDRMMAWFEAYQNRFWHYHAPDEPQGEYVSAPWPDPCMWLGTSIENRKAKHERIDYLRDTPAAVRFLSIEPLLEDLGYLDLEGIHWVIVGGESGSQARMIHPDWVRSIRDQCQAADVPFFFKQWGAWKPTDGSAGVVEKLERGSIGPVFTEPGMTQLDPGWVMVNKVGKSKSGCLLDGREWKEFPA